MAAPRSVAQRNSLIHAYGLFWRRDEINWSPGMGRVKTFRLLGRTGSNKGKLRVIDARKQAGFYILYGNHGPYYAGIANPLGRRLKQHLWDKHEGMWDKFCWFGFNPVLKGIDADGIQKLGKVAQSKSVSPKTIIRDMEALIIRSMALENITEMNFTTADEWTQIKLDEVEKYLSKVS
jgi:hypothetical protein